MQKTLLAALPLILFVVFLIGLISFFAAAFDAVPSGADFLVSVNNLVEKYQALLPALTALIAGLFAVIVMLGRGLFFWREKRRHASLYKRQVVHELQSYFYNLHEAHYGHKDAMRCLLINDQKRAQLRASGAAVFSQMRVPFALSEMTRHPYLTEDECLLMMDIRQQIETFHLNLKASHPELWGIEPFNPGFAWFDQLEESTYRAKKLLNYLVIHLAGLDDDGSIYI